MASKLDAFIAFVSPAWAAKRAVARANFERGKLIEDRLRGFKAASKGRRVGDDWKAVGDGLPTEKTEDLAALRERARELDRNNGYWIKGCSVIVQAVVGHGIRASACADNKRNLPRIQKRWDAWASKPTVDAGGKLDLYAIQGLVMHTIVNDGECLVVRRMSPSGRLKLQLLPPEFLASEKDTLLPNGGEIYGGVETDEFGAAVAYHVYKRHPSRSSGRGDTVRLEAKDVAHPFKIGRVNQQRGISWCHAAFPRLHDWEEYEDADLMRQKVAACFGVVYTGIEPEATESGAYEPSDKIEPGMVEYLPQGTDVKTIAPPASLGLRDAYVITMRGVAAALGITYEALSGDYSNVNFSSGRMGHLQMQKNVTAWQNRIMIDLFLDRVWGWFMEAESLQPVDAEDEEYDPRVTCTWTAPSVTMIDPEKENAADNKAVRNGFTPWQDIVRSRGRDPDETAAAIKEDMDRWDRFGIVLDCDPRHVSAQGQGSINQKQEEGKDDGSPSEQKAA